MAGSRGIVCTGRQGTARRAAACARRRADGRRPLAVLGRQARGHVLLHHRVSPAGDAGDAGGDGGAGGRQEEGEWLRLSVGRPSSPCISRPCPGWPAGRRPPVRRLRGAAGAAPAVGARCQPPLATHRLAHHVSAGAARAQEGAAGAGPAERGAGAAAGGAGRGACPAPAALASAGLGGCEAHHQGELFLAAAPRWQGVDGAARPPLLRCRSAPLAQPRRRGQAAAAASGRRCPRRGCTGAWGCWRRRCTGSTCRWAAGASFGCFVCGCWS